ncbi:MAG: hypothetical protein WBR35_05605 [Anaerolineae bacterium]
MNERTRLSKYEDKDAVYVMDFWTDGDYAYFSYDITSKKGRQIDVITEQSTRVLPEILAKRIFWDRLKGRLSSDIAPYLKQAGITAEIEYVGEPDLRLSNVTVVQSDLKPAKMGRNRKF